MPADSPGTSGEATTEYSIKDEPVVEVFSRPAVVKILKVFADGVKTDFPPSDIIEQAEIGRNAWYDNKDILLEYGFIEQTRSVGNPPMYRADTDAEPMQAFIHLYDALNAADTYPN